MRSVITGSGTAIPSHVVTNEALSHVMDTSDEWIRSRSGVCERRFVKPGVTTSDLAAKAIEAAADSAHISVDDLDAIVTATMTPDLVAPGISGLVQHRLGISDTAMYDIRHQCSGFLFGLDVADALIRSGKARTVAVAGAEVHSGYLPWDEAIWAYLRNQTSTRPPQHSIDRATAFRDWSVLFGDGAGAMIVSATDDESAGFCEFSLHTDGSLFDLIMVPGVGFKHRPYVNAVQLDADLHLPTMRGRALFREAVTRMPDAIRSVVGVGGYTIEDVDLVIAHQANARIVDAVAGALGLDRTVVPVNIEKYGNTTAATLPILFHEVADRINPRTLVCFTAFGAGAHWGAAMYVAP